ncbi:MAG: hypothetical protein KF861_09940 [Planctomycetaceae bacterium]|nr:hypothetical protein [Planctomycetaceae bacterium]
MKPESINKSLIDLLTPIAAWCTEQMREKESQESREQRARVQAANYNAEASRLESTLRVPLLGEVRCALVERVCPVKPGEWELTSWISEKLVPEVETVSHWSFYHDDGDCVPTPAYDVENVRANAFFAIESGAWKGFRFPKSLLASAESLISRSGPPKSKR